MAGLGARAAAQTQPLPRAQVVRLGSLEGTVWPLDANGDGITDLAGDGVAVALGRGDGTFSTPAPAGFDGGVLGAADVNGDRKSDVIVRSSGDEPAVAILPNNGDGTFGEPRIVDAIAATFVVSADFDGDGARDLAFGVEPESLVVYPGRGDFSFAAPVVLTTGAFPQDAIVADFDADGRRDIAVANRYGFSITTFRNRGAFVFTPHDIPAGLSVTDVTAADVTGDARIDLVAAARSQGDGTPAFTDGFALVFPGNGDGTFQPAVSHAVEAGAFQVVVGDFTRDGRIDIATANNSFTFRDDCGVGSGGSDSVSVLPGLGGGAFGNRVSFALRDYRRPAGSGHDFTDTVVSLNTSDVNRDGSTDLIASDGALLLTSAPGAHDGIPAVDAGEDRTLVNETEVVLQASAFDADADLLDFVWTLPDGSEIRSSSACVSGLEPGPNTFTLTVDDRYGHRVSDRVTYTVEDPDPPVGGSEPLSGRDVGAVAATGRTSFDGSNYSVSGSGADIWNRADEFHFAERTMRGDFEIVALVESVQNADVWTKAGLMVRDGLSPAARHVSAFATPGKGVAFQRRTSAGGLSAHTAGPALTAPVWLMLTRRGDRVTAAFRRSAADAWTTIGSETLAGLPREVHAGLAVTSHHDGVVAEAVFSHVAAAALSE